MDVRTWRSIAKDPAERACQRQFEVEIEDDNEIDFSWTAVKGGVEVTITQNRSDFKVTRATFSYSIKTCDSAVDDDFHIYGTASFESIIPGVGDEMTAKIDLEDWKFLNCQRRVSVYGKRVK